MVIIPFSIIESFSTNACHTIANRNICKTCTIAESTRINSYYIITNYYLLNATITGKPVLNMRTIYCNTCKSGTIFKGPITNTCHTAWNCHTCKTSTTIESITTNTCNTVWYCNTCKTGTITESLIANACNTAWYLNISTASDRTDTCKA